MAESLVIDVIILHTTDKALRKKYLQENKLDCEKIIEIYKNHKITTLEADTINSTQAKQRNKHTTVPKETEPSQPKQKNKPTAVPKETEPSNFQQKRHCWRCKTTHEMRQCPARNYKCKKCNELHHFEVSCRNVLSQQNKLYNKDIVSHSFYGKM